MKQMLTVALCHAARDRAVAEKLAERLELCAEARVLRQECGAPPNAHVAEMWDTAAEAAILLLSPDSVPRGKGRELWGDLLAHLEKGESPSVACLLLDPCSYPLYLERKRFLRWNDDANSVLRSLERWIVGLQAVENRAFEPARLNDVDVPPDELEALWSALVDTRGTVRLDRPRSWILAQEFARCASEYFRDIVWWRSGDPAPVVDSRHRVLLIAEGGEPELAPDRHASLLLLPATEAELVAGEGGVVEQAWSACAGPLVPLDLLGWVAGADVREQAQRLLDEGWAAPFDAGGRRLRRLRRIAVPTAMGLRHAEVLADAFSGWADEPLRCQSWLAEWPVAWNRAVVADWPLALRLAWPAAMFLRAEDRIHEAAEIYRQLERAAVARHDRGVAEQCRNELYWLLGAGGTPMSSQPVTDQLSFAF